MYNKIDFTGTKSKSRISATGTALWLVMALAAGSAHAQDAAKPEAAASSQSDASDAAPAGEILVTGTRVQRSGFQTPNPTTVLGTDQINATAATNIADAINRLPSAGAGLTPRVQTIGTSGGTAGLNILNLRNLGNTRTLVLLDGRRLPGSTSSGLVNVNTIPSQLVESVDVVTGGVSAAYGSDAVAGVVNFVLKKNFTGLAAEAQTGISKYGDGQAYKFAASFGTAFADGRGHFILSGEWNRQKSIDSTQGRDWFKSSKLVANPSASSPATAANPTNIQANGVYLRDATLGGLIVKDAANPLALQGIQFGASGAQSPFAFGTFSGTADLMIGGTPNDVPAALAPLQGDVENKNLFTRLSFDVAPDVNLYAEGSYGTSNVGVPAVHQFFLGNLVIAQDNAFLAKALTPAQLALVPATGLKVGTLNGDVGKLFVHNNIKSYRGLLGISAKLGGSWKLDGYYQYGRTDSLNAVENELITARYRQAIDAISVGNQIVCRNAANGCVPLNIFGTGVASKEALAWAMGTAQRNSKIEQQVASLTLAGEPFSTWAGPVSIALGGEYRKESTHETVDALSLASAYFSGNFKPVNGSYDVKEGFLEAVVPLAKDLPFARSLEFNAAVRATDYSTSGGVTTWKLGATWKPIDDLLIRVVRSRDIRAPNLADLFAVTQATQTVNNRFLPGNPSNTITAFLNAGNPNLKPEKANNLVIGAVYSPSWLPGFNVSVDYYNFKIRNYIVSLAPGTQQAVDLCFQGISQICDLITFDANKNITSVRLAGVNAGRLDTSGLDIETAYRTDLGRGRLTVRVLASYLDKLVLDTGLTKVDSAGEVSAQNGNSAPHWRGTASVNYTQGGFSSTLMARYIGSGVVANSFDATVLSTNHIPSVTYFDANIGYRFEDVTGQPELYLSVDNIFNKAPPTVSPLGGLQFLQQGTNPFLYDVIGTAFRAGVRVKF